MGDLRWGAGNFVSLALQLSSQELVKQEPAWGGGGGGPEVSLLGAHELGRPLEEGPPRRQGKSS